MTRADFQRLAKLRLREASALMRLGHFPGAYYLAGYSVECALKACIAKRTRRHDFPDKRIAQEAWTHDLEDLVKVAQLDADFRDARKASGSLDDNWAVVKDWSEDKRYELRLSEQEAKVFISACRDRKNGVISWIRKRW